MYRRAHCKARPMANDLSAVPDILFGTWKQLSGIYVDLETGEERPGLSKAPNGYIHFARDGRIFNLTVDSSRQRPAGARPTAAEAEALLSEPRSPTRARSGCDGNQVLFDLDVSWNESWTGSRQVRTFELKGDRSDDFSRDHQSDDGETGAPPFDVRKSAVDLLVAFTGKNRRPVFPGNALLDLRNVELAQQHAGLLALASHVGGEFLRARHRRARSAGRSGIRSTSAS